jgi:phosphatidylcholine synthase
MRAKPLAKTDRSEADPLYAAYGRGRKLLAWAVHIFTSSGAIVGFLSLVAIIDRNWLSALLWLFCALVIDSLDGTLARVVQVKRVLPNFDGRMLDYVIDFLTFVLLPTLFLYKADLLPASVRLVCVGAILFVSCYHYGNLKAVTDDFHFKGFPAMWNVVAFYLFVLGLNPWWNVFIILVVCFLHFAPIKFIYPTRTAMFRGLTLPLLMLLALVNLIILFQQPFPNPSLLIVSLLILVYLVAVSFYQTYLTRNSSRSVLSNSEQSGFE